MNAVALTTKDALLVVDTQNDFLPGGSLAVREGNAVVPVLNRCIATFSARSLPIYATRDWHPRNHCSFQAQGGPWPPHCVAESHGAAFPAELKLPPGTRIISKAMTPAQEAYSGFEGTDLASQLRSQGVTRVFIGGLTTDYCVLTTVMDALANGFEVMLLTDAIRPVEVHAGDGQAAIERMIERGARPLTSEQLDR